jgi:hypothetical protein
MERTFITTFLAISTLAVTAARSGTLDDWGKPALTKQFFMAYRIKFHQEGAHIMSITLAVTARRVEMRGSMGESAIASCWTLHGALEPV